MDAADETAQDRRLGPIVRQPFLIQSSVCVSLTMLHSKKAEIVLEGGTVKEKATFSDSILQLRNKQSNTGRSTAEEKLRTLSIKFEKIQLMYQDVIQEVAEAEKEVEAEHLGKVNEEAVEAVEDEEEEEDDEEEGQEVEDGGEGESDEEKANQRWRRRSSRLVRVEV